MAHGAWCLAHGAWCMAHGAWCMAHGAWRMAHGAWYMAHVHGAWRMVQGTLRAFGACRDRRPPVRLRVWAAPADGCPCMSVLPSAARPIMPLVRRGCTHAEVVVVVVVVVAAAAAVVIVGYTQPVWRIPGLWYTMDTHMQLNQEAGAFARRCVGQHAAQQTAWVAAW
eukprot:364132-Chlamydomonas_euryale.AAC.1